MQQALGFEIGVASFFGCFEATDLDACDVLVARLPNPARETGSLPLLVPVLHVYGHRDIAQVADSVVEFVPVDVVNLGFWPSAVKHEPCEPMQFNLLAVNGKFPVSVLDRPNLGPNPGEASIDQPTKGPGMFVVRKQFSRSRQRQRRILHT